MSWIAVWEFSTGKLLSLASSIPDSIRNPQAPQLVDENGDLVFEADGVTPVLDPDWVQPYGYTEWADRASSGEFENDWNTATKAFDIPKDIPAEILTPYGFLKLFTQPERILIRQLAETNDNVKDWLELNVMNSGIERGGEDMVQGLTWLVQNGHMTVARANEINGTA